MGVTDVDGRFRLESLTPGTYDFALFLGEPGIVDDVKLRSTASLSLGAGDDRELSFDLPSGRLRVRLVDDKTGAAEAGAIAFAVPKDSTRERGRFAGFEFFPGWVATTDFEGRAVLLGLPVGLPHILEAGTKDRRLKGGVAESLPVTDPAGAEIVIRLK